MRTSNRRKILDAIIAIVERDGITAVTFDAVAAETGLTRGGLLYLGDGSVSRAVIHHNDLIQHAYARQGGEDGANPPGLVKGGRK